MKWKAKIPWPSFMAFIFSGGIIFFASCEKYIYQVEIVNPVDTVHFQAQIQPLFTSNCVGCHGGTRNPDLRAGNSYEALTVGGYVNPPAETSVIIQQLSSGSHSSYLIDAEKQLILIWIQQGAKNN
jgi:hypothetical protein